jgi:hypothetical protein
MMAFIFESPQTLASTPRVHIDLPGSGCDSWRTGGFSALHGVSEGPKRRQSRDHFSSF